MSNSNFDIRQSDSHPNTLTVENTDALADFLSDNVDIVDIINKAISVTLAQPNVKRANIDIFEDPLSHDRDAYSLYINAIVYGSNYDEAYDTENVVFEQAIKPDFSRLRYRILLSFDTEFEE